MQPTYTPTAANVTPAYGQQSEGVLQLQKDLNTKNAGTAGYTPIPEDAKYGPLTQAAVNFQPSSIVQTSGAARTEYGKNSASLDNALNSFNIGTSSGTPDTSATTLDSVANDPYIQSLDALSQNSDAATKMLIANIQAAKQKQVNSLDTQYGNYKSGLQLLGIQHNEAQSSPELLMGHIQQAETEHQDKLADLDSEESKALLDANNARQTQDFNTLNSKMDYVKQIQQQKADTLKSYYDTITQQPKIADDVAHNVYQTLQTLDDSDKQQFIQQVAQQFNLPLGTLVTALNDEQFKTQTADVKTKTAQANLDKKNVTKTPGATTTAATKVQVANGQKKLDASRGPDGYVDPAVYQEAYSAWPGTLKTFLLAYPPATHVNPANTTLPAYLRPKAKTTSTRSSS